MAELTPDGRSRRAAIGLSFGPVSGPRVYARGVRDAVIAGLLVTAFTVFVVTHLVAVLRLARRGGRTGAWVAFVLLPLAPVRAWREGWRVLAGIWAASAVAYGILDVLARR